MPLGRQTSLALALLRPGLHRLVRGLSRRLRTVRHRRVDASGAPVIVTNVPPDDQATTPALFLAGKGHLAEDFTSSLAEPPAGSPAGSRAIKLVPKAAQPDYDWLIWEQG